MKKIMILGAGIYQVPLIKKANEMGLFTIVVSIPGNYPGFQYADKVYYEDTTSFNSILDIAKREKIDGIVTAGTDVAVITVGKVCDELNLKGLSYESAIIASDKMKMKTRYIEEGVRTAKFKYAKINLEDVISKADGLQYPLIFKAVDSSGSRGIVRVNKQEEFGEALNIVSKVTKKDYFIIEEFLTGEEFGAQAFIYNGKIQFIMPHGDYVFFGNAGVPIGHWAPFELAEDIIEDAKEQLQKAALAMKLDNCAINADFILHNGKTYVLELGGRSGATCLAEMVSLYYGFDYYEKIILACLGEKVDFASNAGTANAAMLLISDKSGYIEEIQNSNSDDYIIEIQYDYSIGDFVKKFQVGPDRIGHIIVKGENSAKAMETLENALKKITIKVKEKV